MKIQKAKKTPWQPLKSLNPVTNPLSVQELVLAFSKNDENKVDKLLMQGGRGTGKTETMSAVYLQHVNKGYGEKWKGLCLRHSYDALKDVFERFKAITDTFFIENVEYKVLNSSDEYCVKFKWGEIIYFRALDSLKTYETKFKGQEYPFIWIEELTTILNIELVDLILTCNRAANTSDGVKVPVMFRATTNPDGPLHEHIKRRFIKASKEGEILENVIEHPLKKGTFIKETQMHLYTILTENYMLPDDYVFKIEALKHTNYRLYRMYMFGDWDVQVDTLFSDVYEHQKQVIKPFKIPSYWQVKRAFDWGTSDPFCYLCYAISDGTPFLNYNGKLQQVPKGSIFIIKEYYGAESLETANKGLQLPPSTVSKNIKDIELNLRTRLIDHNQQIIPGPADDYMLHGKKAGLKTIYDYFLENDVKFSRGIKSNQSIEQGIEIMKEMLNNTKEQNNRPHLYFFDTCKFSVDTIFSLKADPTFPDRPAQKQADHACDVVRMIVLEGSSNFTIKSL